MLISESASNHVCNQPRINHLCEQEPEFCSCEDGTTFSLATVRAAQVGDDDGLDNDKISGLGLSLTASDLCFSSVRAAAVRGQTATVLHLSRGHGDYTVDI